MDIAERTEQGVSVVGIGGRVDGSTAAELERRLLGALQTGAPLLVDLSGLGYISSAGLRSFLKAAKQAKAAGVPLALAGPQAQVREVFEVAGFLPLFTVHADTAAGLAALAGAPHVPASAVAAAAPAPEGSHPTLLEEVVLLGIDEETGVPRPTARSVLDLVVAGAALMELALLGRVDSDLETTSVTDATPTGEPLLDGVLATLAASGPGATADRVSEIAAYGAELREKALDRLVARGILRCQEGRILWIFRDRRYPVVDGRERREVRARLRDLLLGTDIPDARDVVLVCLVDACGLFGAVLNDEEFTRAKPRIAQIRRMDLIGQEVERSIVQIEAAIARSMLPV
ncbi:MAG TPA: anti-sigma factor antagonist [Azospirillum sp.]|nr:anti-sigma factor antagonist [Azospirillum sp.]